MLVQGFNCLFDPKCKDYRTRSTRDEAWESIFKTILGDTCWEELNLKDRRKFGM